MEGVDDTKEKFHGIAEDDRIGEIPGERLRCFRNIEF